MTIDADDLLRLPAISGWLEQVTANAHTVAADVATPARPRFDTAWAPYGVSITTGDTTGRSAYATRLTWRITQGEAARRAVTSQAVAATYTQLRPRIAARAGEWHPTLDARDIAMSALVGIWRGLAEIATWTPNASTAPNSADHIPYLLACIDNAITDELRRTYGSATPEKMTRRVHSTVPLDSYRYERTRQWEDPTEQWCQWLDTVDAVNASPYRLTLTMHVAGYSDQEIATQTGWTANTVKQRRHELRRHLRDVMK